MNIKCLLSGHSYKSIFAVDVSQIITIQQASAGSVIPCFKFSSCLRCGKVYIEGKISQGDGK